MDALIIKLFWAEKILDGEKTWEIRGSNAKKRGAIAIAESGTGCLFGEVELENSIPLTKELWEENRHSHHVGVSWDELLQIYANPHAWIFKKGSAIRYEEPVPYIHRPGAVIWVKNATIEQEVER